MITYLTGADQGVPRRQFWGSLLYCAEIGIILAESEIKPGIFDVKARDHKISFDIHRKATAQAIHKAMTNQPSIDWLLENQDKIVHKYFERGLKGEI